MLENWKIRDRLLLGYAIPTIIFSVFSGIVYVNASQTIDTFQRGNKLQGVVFGSDDMILRVSLMARQVRGYLLVGNAENSLESFNKQKDLYKKSAGDVNALIQDKAIVEQLPKFQRMQELESQFEELSTKTFRLFDDGKQKIQIILKAILDFSS